MRVPDGRASKSLEFVFTTIYVINTLVSSYAFELRVRHGSRLYSMPGYLPPLATCTLPFGMFHLLTYGNRSLGLICKLLFTCSRMLHCMLYVSPPTPPVALAHVHLCLFMLLVLPYAPSSASPPTPRPHELVTCTLPRLAPTQSAHSYPIPYTGTQLNFTYPRQLPPTSTAAHIRSFTDASPSAPCDSCAPLCSLS
jgi:hypothetical protein